MNTKDRFLEGTRGLRTYKFTPRIPVLQALNGTKFTTEAQVEQKVITKLLGYDGAAALSFLCKSANIDINKSILHGKVTMTDGKVSDRNIGKWLTQAHFPEAMVSKLCALKVNGAPLEVTTRYKDLARMGNSPHYDTCASTQSTIPRRLITEYYLHKCNVFLLVTRDNQGEFRSRIIGRLTKILTYQDEFALSLSVGTEVILLNRTYGVKVTIPAKIGPYPVFQHNTEHYKLPSVSTDMVLFEVGPNKIGVNPNCGRHINVNDYSSEVFDDLLEYPQFGKSPLHTD